MNRLKQLIRKNTFNFFSIVSILLFLSACSSPKVLQERDDVPPPVYNPPSELTGDGIHGEALTVSETSTAQKDEELPGFPKIEKSEIKYTVKKGESFWSIAKKYGVSMKELAAYNNMDLKKTLLAGTTLNIPPGGKLISEENVSTSTFSKGTPVSQKDKKGNYTVRPGDSLWLISKKFGTTIAAITSANGIAKNAPLKVGQKLYIPNKKETKAAAESSLSPKEKPETASPSSQTKDNSKLSKEDANLINNLIEEKESSNTESSTDKTSQAKPAQENINYLPHTIKEGDTWDTISEMYGVSIENLKKANPKLSGSKDIPIGTVINIPEE